MEDVKISAPSSQVSSARLGQFSAPPDGPAMPQDTFVPSKPAEGSSLVQAPHQTARSGRRRAMGIAALGLVALGTAAGLTPGPTVPVTYTCSEGKVLTTTEREPSLVGSLLERLNGGEVSTRGKLILQCESVSKPSELKDPQHRADLVWEALVTNMGGQVEHLRDHKSLGALTAWPYGQTMAASLDRAKLSGDYTEFDRMVAGLKEFKSEKGGYHPGSLGGDRFYDDNAWIGLVFMQAHQQVPDQARKAEYLEKAREVMSFLDTGMSAEGGILWKENSERPTYNTCALGPTIELEMRLFEATGEARYLDQAIKMDRFMDANLRLPSGLYADNLTTDLAQRDGTIYSYNQGTPIGAKVMLHRATGDARYLAEARQTADAALQHFGTGDRLFRHSPAFNAIFFRNLLTLDPAYRGAVEDYTSQVWARAMDDQTGLLSQGGLGAYDAGKIGIIDQAGLVQLNALLAWPVEDLPSVT